MDGLDLHINNILAELNPLSVPAGLAECEYSSYVPALARAVRNKCDVECVLLQMLWQMGMEKPYCDDVMADVIRTSRQIERLECQQVWPK